MSILNRVFGGRDGGQSDVFTGLRSKVLHVQPSDLGIAPTESEPVYGVVMETGLHGGTATFVCLADGTVSLYTSTGGGVIGAGRHEQVRAACLELIDWTNTYASAFIEACEPAGTHPLPKNGAVFFYLLTTSGAYLAQCSEAKLAAQQDPFSNLFSGCHDVMTEARKVTERR